MKKAVTALCSFRGTKVGHSLAWTIALTVIAIGAVTISLLIAIISATVLAQICIISGNFSTSAVAVVSLSQILLLFLNTSVGISKKYIVPILSVFVISLVLYLFKATEYFTVVTFWLSLSIGEIFSCLGVFVIAQCVTFALLACPTKYSFWALSASFLISARLALVSVNTVQTKVSGNFSFTLILLFSIFITACAIAQKALKGDKKFRWLMPQAVYWAACGGTSFKGLDLSGIDFTEATLANTDLRAKKLHRTCFKSVKGLARARVDNAYFDFDNSKVQNLLINGYSRDTDFSKLNLRGVYLQDANLQHFRFTEANLNGADLKGADLRESILLRTILTDADLSYANLTGACIKDWSFNQQTYFDNITCDYVYREYENDRPTDRYPPKRNFESGEFQSLFQKLTNAVELVFNEQIDWRALSFAFEKFQIEDDGMGLELKGVEQRGDYWIVKVAHGEGVSKQQVEQQVQSTYADLRALMEVKDRQINQLLGIVDNQTRAMNQQAEALTHFSQHPFGNSFFITGSTITNLAGSGQIEYQEAASSIRQLIAPIDDKAGEQADDLSGNQAATLRRLIAQMSEQNVATTVEAQKDLIQQILLSEADRDPQFKQLLLQQGEQIVQSLPRKDIAIAFQAAIAQLKG